jgi:hypothetical protein
MIGISVLTCDLKAGAPTLGIFWITILAAGLMYYLGVLWWDSKSGFNPTHSTHTYLVDWAIDQLKADWPELQRYHDQLVEGANQELHELTVKGTRYGLELNAKRIEHHGTNEGSDDMEGWWRDALKAYRANNKDRAYFVLGIMMHMIGDMGVPAHANRVYHQGSLASFDNFEFMALWNWKPNLHGIDRSDPGYAEPWRYYRFSEDWTRTDAPNYKNRSTFSKTWMFAKPWERALLRNRQGRTCYVTMWALRSAALAFRGNLGDFESGAARNLA